MSPQTAVGSIGDIIVTAQRRSERLQDVPIAIQAFDSAALEQSGIARPDDLPMIVPAMTFNRSAGGSVPYIRGIGGNDATAGQEAPVSTYVDGVYIQSLYSNNLALKNIARVEVLKGPQGTLFGRNATGGLIHIITKDPSSTPSGEFEVSAGDHQTYTTSGYATSGITANLAADVSYYVRRQEKGYGINLTTGTDTNFNNEYLIRSKWKYTGDSTSLTLIGDYTRIESAQGLNRNLLPGVIGAAGNRSSGRYYDTNNNLDFVRNTKAYGGSLQIDHDFGDANLVYIGSIRRDRSSIVADTDVGPAVVAYFRSNFFTNTMSHEVRLSSDTSGRSSWIGGLYYLNSKGGPHLRVFAGPAALLVSNLVGQVKTDSYSIFGEYALKLFGQGRLTIGGRYTIDKREASGSSNGVTTMRPDLEKTFKEPTYRVVYDHHINDDVMVFASYNRGFKSGNYNLQPISAPFDPETLDSYEVGTKTSFMNGKLRFNASAFHYKYKNLQVRITRGFTTSTFNAAAAEVNGMEGDLSFSPFAGLTFNAAAAYVDSKYVSFRSAQSFVPVSSILAPGQRCPGVTTGAAPTGGNCIVPADATGKPLIRSPKFSGNLGVTWEQPLASGNLTSTVRISYRDGFNWEPDGRVPEHNNTLINGSIVWKTADEGLGIGIRAENLLASRYQILGGSVEAGDYYSAGSPRTYSVFAEFKF
ncbi:TonB-dependent receptor [Sphingobium sp. AN558]|uniref:TonB-dependent receptor n=1 Tax=Sphingobium sp. AN558 TaxID=3133442 RepID=UPI0030C63C91